jgi:hypothetical protein
MRVTGINRQFYFNTVSIPNILIKTTADCACADIECPDTPISPQTHSYTALVAINSQIYRAMTTNACTLTLSATKISGVTLPPFTPVITP